MRLGPCKRCVKARVRCTTNTNSTMTPLRGPRPMDMSQTAAEPWSPPPSDTATNSREGSAVSQTAAIFQPPSAPMGRVSTAPVSPPFLSQALSDDSSFSTGGESPFEVENFDLNLFDPSGYDPTPTNGTDHHRLSPVPLPESPAKRESHGPGKSGHSPADMNEFSFDALLPVDNPPSVMVKESSTSQQREPDPGTQQCPPPPPPPPPPHCYMKENCLQQLIELHATLLNELQRIRSSIATDVLFASPSSLLVPPDGFGKPDDTSTTGRMFFVSERFLVLIDHFRSSWAPRSDMSSRASSEYDSYSESDADDDVIASNTISGTRRMRIPLGGASIQITPASSTSPHSVATGSATSASSESARGRSDVPTTLTLLTCYICLLRIYGAVFAHMYESLLSHGVVQMLPAAPPGMQLGGLQLDRHHTLQIKILLEVFSHMLERIESSLEMPTERGGFGDKRALDTPMSMALLEVVLRHEGFECSEGNRSGVKPLKQMMKSIKRLLRKNNLT